jgi:molybdate transport system permease protein
VTDPVVTPLLLSLKVALAATAAILPPGILLGLLLSRKEFVGKAAVETLVQLPLVVPPTAVGFLLLHALGRRGILGEERLGVDLGLLFTWKGAALASAVMALPLVARTARVAFDGVDPRLTGMARTLGSSPVRAFVEVTVPLARRGLLAAGVLGFARALGEFGATILVAGSIPGKTQTLALAIFQDMTTGHDRDAMVLVAVTVAIAFAAVWIVEALLRKHEAAA